MSDDNLRRFCSITKIDLIYENADGEMTVYFDSTYGSPLARNSTLRNGLRDGGIKKNGLYVLKDSYNVCYTALRYRDGWLYIGPMGCERLSQTKLKEYYRTHGIESSDARPIRSFTPREITDITMLFATSTRNTALTEEEVLSFVGVAGESDRVMKKEKVSFILGEEEKDDEGAWRHSYREEQLLMQAIRDGRALEAVRIAENMDADAGRLSSWESGHWKNHAIVDIALCARAAIEAGVSPEAAYRISGYFIKKCDAQQEQSKILGLRNKAIEEFVTYVNGKGKTGHTSNYIEACRDYIRKHYREKICLDTIADRLGITPAYLSRLFKKDTGICLQEYVNQVRVDRAADLLIYSDLSIPDIAQYVHFPSQSYFGKIFKRFRQTTPKEYRERNKPREFREEKQK